QRVVDDRQGLLGAQDAGDVHVAYVLRGNRQVGIGDVGEHAPFVRDLDLAVVLDGDQVDAVASLVQLGVHTRFADLGVDRGRKGVQTGRGGNVVIRVLRIARVDDSRGYLDFVRVERNLSTIDGELGIGEVGACIDLQLRLFEAGLTERGNLRIHHAV